MSLDPRPRGLEWRGSKRFIIFVVNFSVFSDLVLYGALVSRFHHVSNFQVPVFPFALGERSGIPEDQIQRCVSQLLAAYAFGSLLTKYSTLRK